MNLEELHPKRLIPSITAGFVVGLIEIVMAVSFASLIFSGEISVFQANGIGLALFGTVILTTLIALFSTIPGTIGGCQDTPNAIMAIVAAAIIAGFPAGTPTKEIYLTVLAAIVITTLLTGALFLGLGAFRLGSLVRFLPYPVVGGFLAGTGWLLVIGAIGLMVNFPVNIGNLNEIFTTQTLFFWLPGLIFAIVVLISMNRIKHFLLMPGLILGALALFYLIAWISGLSVSELSSQGWLLGPFPKNRIWQPLTPADLSFVHWNAILNQAINIITIAALSIVALLLNTTGFELAADRDSDLNREMRATGIANLSAGLFSGLVGYHQFSLSMLNLRLGLLSRIPGLLAAGFCALVLLFGGSVLSIFPIFIFGGMLFAFGLAFLYEWVYQSWFRFPKIDYLIILAILFTTATIGFMQGVLVGLVATVVMFVISYSWTSVIKQELNGEIYHSRVTRADNLHRILQAEGDSIFILKLQGFLFFGTVNNLLERIRQRIKAENQKTARYIVLDFEQVMGFDSTALFSFQKMKLLTQANSSSLIFTHLSPGFQKRLTSSGILEEEGIVHSFSDLDHGMQWCEVQVLAAAGEQVSGASQSLQEMLKKHIAGNQEIKILVDYLVREVYEPGQYLIHQGESSDDLFFIESGTITAQLEQDSTNPIRLETMMGGRVVGEMGFYLGVPRTAAVIADETCIVYRLSRKQFEKMEKEDPRAASALSHMIIHLLAERLVHMNRVVKALESV